MLWCFLKKINVKTSIRLTGNLTALLQILFKLLIWSILVISAEFHHVWDSSTITYFWSWSWSWPSKRPWGYLKHNHVHCRIKITQLSHFLHERRRFKLHKWISPPVFTFLQPWPSLVLASWSGLSRLSGWWRTSWLRSAIGRTVCTFFKNWRFVYVMGGGLDESEVGLKWRTWENSPKKQIVSYWMIFFSMKGGSDENAINKKTSWKVLLVFRVHFWEQLPIKRQTYKVQSWDKMKPEHTIPNIQMLVCINNNMTAKSPKSLNFTEVPLTASWSHQCSTSPVTQLREASASDKKVMARKATNSQIKQNLTYY